MIALSWHGPGHVGYIWRSIPRTGLMNVMKEIG